MALMMRDFILPSQATSPSIREDHRLCAVRGCTGPVVPCLSSYAIYFQRDKLLRLRRAESETKLGGVGDYKPIAISTAYRSAIWKDQNDTTRPRCDSL